MAIPKDFLWGTVAQLVEELERVDPQSILASRTRGLLLAREMGMHTTDRHTPKRGAGAGQDDLIASLYLSGKSTYTIAAEIGRGVAFVKNALKRRSIKIRKPGPAQHVSAVMRDIPRIEFIRTARAEGKTLEEIGTELRITRERVRQLCVQNGIPAERNLTPEQKQAVADYVAGESLEQVAARLPHTNPATLKNWITKEGFAIRPSLKTSKRDPETIKKAALAAEMYRAGKATSEISLALGYGTNGGVIYRLLALAGVKPNRGGICQPQQEAA